MRQGRGIRTGTTMAANLLVDGVALATIEDCTTKQQCKCTKRSKATFLTAWPWIKTLTLTCNFYKYLQPKGYSICIPTGAT